MTDAEIKEYLNSLGWDGEKRLDEWLPTVKKFCLDPFAMTQEERLSILRDLLKFFVGAVKLDDGMVALPVFANVGPDIATLHVCPQVDFIPKKFLVLEPVFQQRKETTTMLSKGALWWRCDVPVLKVDYERAVVPRASWMIDNILVGQSIVLPLSKGSICGDAFGPDSKVALREVKCDRNLGISVIVRRLVPEVAPFFGVILGNLLK